ncbi:unnamed protein product [Bathycoccus prasinos]
MDAGSSFRSSFSALRFVADAVASRTKFQADAFNASPYYQAISHASSHASPSAHIVSSVGNTTWSN